MFSVCAGPDKDADIDGTAGGVLTVTSPSVDVVFGEPILLCADILDAEGTLLGW